MVSHSHVKYVHPVTLELDTNLESGTCLRISGAWTQIHCQNQLIKIAITNLYSQKSLKQTTRKKQKTWKTYERTKHTKLYVFKKTAPPCPVDPISSCAIPSQPRARRSSSILTSSMHRKMVVNCSTYVGWSLGVGFNVDSTFTVSYALVLGGVVVDIYIYITPYSFRGCIPVYGGYNHLLCPFIASTATPATRCAPVPCLLSWDLHSARASWQLARRCGCEAARSCSELGW